MILSLTLVPADDEKRYKTRKIIDDERYGIQGKSEESLGGDFSATRVRVMCLAIQILYYCGIIPCVTLITQYIVHRLEEEDGIIHRGVYSRDDENFCQRNESDPRVQAQDRRQADASNLVLYLSYSRAIPGIFICLFFGGFADMVGRKPVILIGLFSTFIRMVGTSIIIWYKLPLWTLFIPNSLDGLGGNWFLMSTALFSTIADVNVSQSQRVFWLTMQGCMSNVVCSLVVVLDGYIIHHFGFFSASLLFGICNGSSILICLFALPETLPKAKRRALTVSMNVKRVFGFFLVHGSVRRRATFAVVLSLFFFSVLNVFAHVVVDPLYQLHRPFCWSPKLIGLYAGFRTGGIYVIGTILLKLMQRCVKDEWIAMGGALFQACSYILEGFVQTTFQFFIVPIIAIPGVTTVPIIRGVMSSLVDTSDQGAILSTISMVDAISSVLGNTALFKVYGATVGIFQGSVYMLLAGYSFLTFILFIVFVCIREEKEYDAIDMNFEKPSEPMKSKI